MIDIEAAMSDVLRADPAIIARVADRCWLTMPATDAGLEFPALVIRRIAGAPPVAFQGALLYDAGQFDIHAYGGSRVEALGLAQDAMKVLCAATHAFVVQPFNLLRFPDPEVPQDNGRMRERYIATVAAAMH